MKVLKDNYNVVDTTTSTQNSIYPCTVICDNCHSEIECEESDVKFGTFGCPMIECPLCNAEIYIDEDNREFKLTKHNIEFPTHFHLTSKETGAVDICNNDEIKKIISKGIDYFRANKYEFVWYYESGNIHLSIYRYDGDEEYYIVVSDRHYSTYIDFESEDY